MKSDWKLYREKLPVWQERFMEKLVQEYLELLQSDRHASEKFWELEKRIRKDKKNPGVMIEVTKSTFEIDLVWMIRMGVITVDDLSDFSDELKETVAMMMR